MKASLEIQHERWAADRWKVMLRVNGVAFAVGAECATLKEAQDLRTEFKKALFELGISLPNSGTASPATAAQGKDAREEK